VAKARADTVSWVLGVVIFVVGAIVGAVVGLAWAVVYLDRLASK